MTASAYRKIEQGITNAPTSRLIEIAEVLEVNVSDFFEENIVSDNREKFGYATKEDVDSILRVIQKIATDFERLREELSLKKPGAKKYVKLKSLKK